MAISIRPAVAADVPAITALQNALLATTAIEWTETEHTVDDRRAWLAAHDDRGEAVLVAVDDEADGDGAVVGFCAYGDFRDSRRWPGYASTVEHTVHVAESHWGSGVGRDLMEALIAHAAAAGKHVIVAAIDAENEGSIRFHERLGFTEVARMPEVGTRFGRWLTLVMLQRTIGSAVPPPG
jgi:L-amino acid N-acyltransferase YncA